MVVGGEGRRIQFRSIQRNHTDYVGARGPRISPRTDKSGVTSSSCFAICMRDKLMFSLSSISFITINISS